MAKTIWYSTPLNFFWDKLYATQKKYTPDYTNDQIFLTLRNNLLNVPLREDESQEDRTLMIKGLELWKEDSDSDFLHIFFLEKQLRDFLTDTPLPDLDSIIEYLYENGKNKRVFYINTGNEENHITYSFGIHIPYENDGYAFSLVLGKDNTIWLFFSKGENTNGHTSDNFYREQIKIEDHRSIVSCKMFRLAINTIAYMNCFPECVTDGVPRITRDRDENRSDSNITFQTSEKITDFEKTKNSRRPHFRKGFFRVLRSSYYTKKKGQIIFVKETMVKGRAKTVSKSSKIEEFENYPRKKDK